MGPRKNLCFVGLVIIAIASSTPRFLMSNCIAVSVTVTVVAGFVVEAVTVFTVIVLV